jgi:hypothetical protein
VTALQSVTPLAQGLVDGASYANAHLAEWGRLGRIARARSAAEVVAALDGTFEPADKIEAGSVAYWSGFAHGVQRVVRSAADRAQ